MSIKPAYWFDGSCFDTYVILGVRHALSVRNTAVKLRHFNNSQPSSPQRFTSRCANASFYRSLSKNVQNIICYVGKVVPLRWRDRHGLLIPKYSVIPVFFALGLNIYNNPHAFKNIYIWLNHFCIIMCSTAILKVSANCYGWQSEMWPISKLGLQYWTVLDMKNYWFWRRIGKCKTIALFIVLSFDYISYFSPDTLPLLSVVQSTYLSYLLKFKGRHTFVML